MKPSSRTHAFTLIEMLVVVAIIGILAGLLVPAVSNALVRTRQIRDVNNAKQLALALMMDANDHNGVFRTGLARGEEEAATGTTRDVFQGLLNDGYLDDPGVVLAEGAARPKDFTLTDENIGYQYIAGYTTSSPSRLPLVFTKGVGVDVATLTKDEFSPGSSAWGSKGLAVAFVGGSAQWITGKNQGGKMKLEAPLGMAPEVPAEVVVYK